MMPGSVECYISATWILVKNILLCCIIIFLQGVSVKYLQIGKWSKIFFVVLILKSLICQGLKDFR